MGKILDDIKINHIYRSCQKKKLNIPKETIEQLLSPSQSGGERGKFNHNADLAFLDDIKKAKNRDDLVSKINSNISKYATYSKNVSLNIALYPLLGKINSAFYKSVPLEVANINLSNKYSSGDLDYIRKNFQDTLVNYISNHNKIKNRLLPLEENNVIDYTAKFDSNMLNSFFDSLKGNKEQTYAENRQLETFAFELILPFTTLYSKEDIKDRKELIDFEMKNGYFDKYYKALNKGEKIPSLEERERIFNNQKNLSREQINLFNEASILEERINSLYNEKFKNKLLAAFKSSIKEKNYSKLQKVYEFYSKVYKKEIFDSLYTPSGRGLTVLEDFNELNNIMIHSFLRNTDSILQRYSSQLKQKIIDNRKDGNINPELTQKEQMIYDGKMEKAKKELANQVIVNKTFDMDSIYSDASGIFQYRSNTSNQISASVVSPLNILKMQPSIGIGFDKNGVHPENIIISSNKYLTTNKGLNNIELSGSELEATSYPLQDMENSNLNEIVMKRQGDHYSTQASYVFVVITRMKEKLDKDNLDKASKLAKENHLPLIVFDVKKLNQSYNELQSKKSEIIKGR